MRILNFLLFSLSFGFLAVSGLLLIQFGEYSFSSFSLVSSILSPFLIALFLAFSTTRSSVFRFNVAACFLGVIFVTYLAEAVMQLGWISYMQYDYQKKIENFDKRTNAEVIRDLKKEGKTAYPVVNPQGLFKYEDGKTLSSLGDLLPLAGISSVTTVFCNETGKYLIYESDEYGFHNPKKLWSRAPVDIVAFGDSYTQGACVDSDKNYVSKIRERYPLTLSLGTAGNGPLAMLAGIREYVPHLKPKVVLWFYYEQNDISEDLPIESKAQLLIRYLEDPSFSQGLLGRQAEINQRIKTWLNAYVGDPSVFYMPPKTNFIGRINVNDLVLLRRLRGSLNILIGPSREYVTLFKSVLREAKKTIGSHGGNIYVVNLPGKRRYMNFTGNFSQNLRRDRVFTVLEELDIPVIDLDLAFGGEEDPVSNFLFHYNDKGNATVARAVLEALEGKVK